MGCFHIAGWIGRIGHIRSFAAGAAVCVASVLLFSLTELLVPLLIVRFTAGLATAGLFAIGDAWISQSANEANRGRLLATYAIVLGTMSFGSQMTIQFLPDDLDDAFVVISLLYCLAIVVLTAARTNPPAAHTDASVRILALFKDSPTAWIGSFTVGMVATTLLNLSPYRAAAQGVDPKDIALALGALYLGRIIFMYPLGRASDRYDRRTVILISGTVAAVILLYLSVAGEGDGSRYKAILLLTMYSVLVAHAMDRTVPVYVASASVTMLFVWTLGGAMGPLLASLISVVFGDGAASWLLASLITSYTIFVAFRIRRTKPTERAEKTSFRSTDITSIELAPAKKTK